MKKKKENFWAVISHTKHRQGEHDFLLEDTFSWRRKDAIKKAIVKIYGRQQNDHCKRIMNQTIEKTWKEEMKSYSAQKFSLSIRQNV